MKIKAAVCRAFGAPLTIETVELAKPGPGEVMIRTAACAICHSDIFFVDGAWGGDLPAVYGHEAAGVVEAVGPGVTRLKIGDPASKISQLYGPLSRTPCGQYTALILPMPGGVNVFYVSNRKLWGFGLLNFRVQPCR